MHLRHAFCSAHHLWPPEIISDPATLSRDRRRNSKVPCQTRYAARTASTLGFAATMRKSSRSTCTLSRAECFRASSRVIITAMGEMVGQHAAAGLAWRGRGACNHSESSGGGVAANQKHLKPQAVVLCTERILSALKLLLPLYPGQFPGSLASTEKLQGDRGPPLPVRRPHRRRTPPS
jgi:hypothetical protein